MSSREKTETESMENEKVKLSSLAVQIRTEVDKHSTGGSQPTKESIAFELQSSILLKSDTQDVLATLQGKQILRRENHLLTSNNPEDSELTDLDPTDENDARRLEEGRRERFADGEATIEENNDDDSTLITAELVEPEPQRPLFEAQVVHKKPWYRQWTTAAGVCMAVILVTLVVVVFATKKNGSESPQVFIADSTAAPTPFQGTNWERKGSVLYGTYPHEEFGVSVQVSNDGRRMVATGRGVSNTTLGEDGQVLTYPGTVRVYDFDEEEKEWRSHGIIMIGDASEQNLGSGGIALSGDGSTVAAAMQFYQFKGLIRVLQYNETLHSWTQLGQDIEGTDLDHFFGVTLQLSNDGRILAANAMNPKDMGGMVKVFQFDETTNSWSQMGANVVEIEPEDTDFGPMMTMSESGERVVLRNGLDGGTILSFQWDGSSWMPFAEPLTREEGFGFSLDCSFTCETIVVSFVGASSESNVQVFDLEDGVWNQRGDPVPVDNKKVFFNVAASADGNRFAVGLPLNGYGLVEAYEWLPTNGSDQQGNGFWKPMGTSLRNNEGGVAQLFGFSIDLSADGTTLIFGAQMSQSETGVPRAGRVEVYNFVE